MAVVAGSPIKERKPKMSKETVEAICRKINSFIDEADDQPNTKKGQQARQLFLERAAGLRDALNIAKADYTSDEWGKCWWF